MAKGHRLHTIFLHPKLVRRFRRMIAEGRTETYEPPASPAKEWFLFLTRAGIKKKYPGACFHSLRVTAATTLARKGISEKKAMDYIGHASTTIHRSYVRLKPEDLSVCADALG
jgi:integrase